MDNFLPIVLALCGLIALGNSALYYTYFWQLKEYRWDRMKDYLSTKSGRGKIFNWLLLGKLLLLLLVLLSLLRSLEILPFAVKNAQYFTEFYYLNLFGMFLVLAETLGVFYRLTKRRLYRPDKTAKALLIVALTILLSVAAVLIWTGPPRWTDISFIIYGAPSILYYSAIIAPVVNALIVACFYPITLISKAFVLSKAKRKLAQMQGLKVVGITGSYGKSSVKEFLAQILSGKFQVLKTPGNTNTEIGVAGVILKYLKPEDEVFIFEAGAYKIGEIKKICDMVAPRIAIVTAVKDAHLSLFGSLENIKKAKFELIEGLPEFGTAIFNGDNDGAEDLAKRASKLKLSKIIRYGTAAGTDLKALEITETLDGITFQLDDVQFSAALPGRHNVSNLLAAIACALELGMKLPEIAEKVKKVKLREHTLTPIRVNENLVLVDDTYNANPDGVVAALSYLGLYQGWQKICVFPGMLELGEKSDEEHRRVARKIAEVCDYAFFTSRDFDKPLTEELKKASFSDFQFVVDDQEELLKAIRQRAASNSSEKTVIVFSSRGSEQVIKKLANAS
jgi:UDP-N-acetylmuramoyl-tripeptide--D-alanyl-D-alanine ligase